MNNHCSWITYNGVKLLLCNFTGIQDLNEYLGCIEEMEKAILSQPKGTRVPCLMDMSNSRLFKEVSDRARKMTSTVKEAGYPDSPTAIVGASGFQKAVISAFSIVRKDIQVFDDQQSAKDWLVKRLK